MIGVQAAASVAGQNPQQQEGHCSRHASIENGPILLKFLLQQQYRVLGHVLEGRQAGRRWYSLVSIRWGVVAGRARLLTQKNALSGVPCQVRRELLIQRSRS